MEPIVNYAQAWASKGYFVFPVTLTAGDDGKKIVDFGQLSWKDSTRDSEVIANMFLGAEGIAVDTGKSGIVVIDVDISGGKDGLRNLRDAGIELPRTPMTATTWSGGFHGFFRQPEQPVGSGSNKPVKSVDFRGQGGVVFVAPTVVVDNQGVAGEYRLNTPMLAVEALPVLPGYWASRLKVEPAAAKPEASKRVYGPNTLRDDQRDLLERYAYNDLDVIRRARDGERNQVLGATTLLLADRYRKLGLSLPDLQRDVRDAYLESGGSDEDQANTWCRSSWSKSGADPLDVPRTYIDDMADQRHARMVADRLARARVTGATARLVGSGSFVDWSQPPPDARFWVAGVVPQGEQVVLYGRPEAGKTFTAIDLGMSIALGRKWFGRDCVPGRVWFMAGEGNARITSRIHAWMDHHGARPDPGRFRLLNHVPDLMNEQVMEQMAQRVAEDEVDVVFIDTLGRAMAIGGGDISSPPDAAQALKSLQVVSRYRPGVTPIAIHHPIKEGGMAGAYNLLGGLDVVIHAEVDDGGTGVLRFAKNKDGEKSTLATYRWRQSGPSAVLVPATQEHRPVDTWIPGEDDPPEDPFEHERMYH